jgi:hypothetical protein
MNTARIWKLITAGLVTAGLLVAVPTESQALAAAPTHSSVGSSSTGAASLPAVTPGEVKAAPAMLPECGCPPNAGEVKYALTELGVKSLSDKLLRKRLGKQVGDDAFAALAASLSKKAATVRKRVPFPNYKAKTAITYAKSPYRVYEIYGTGLGPEYPHWTWKYGITRQLIPAQRPEGQLKNCTKYYGPRNLINRSCTYRWLWIGVGWLQARTMEAAYTLLYVIAYGVGCPPGMPACV